MKAYGRASIKNSWMRHSTSNGCARCLAQEYKSSGYNLRRLTTDQTQKLNANLSQMRQQQVGVEQYEWVTSEDERVRPTHSDNNRRMFDWSNPPGATGHPGHDVMCQVLC